MTRRPARVRIAALLFVALALLPASAARADYDDGSAAFARGDYTNALKEFLPLAGAGHVEAQFRLGVMYGEARGVPRNRAKAVMWLTRAAEQGHVGAMGRLGVMYLRGSGVPRDLARAARWYRRAAAAGDADAQAGLGFMFSKGQGVPQHYGQAAMWYARAAAQGHALAQANLGDMYRDGRGVARDLVLAHMWMNLAAAALDGRASRDAAENRDAVARGLAADAVARAQEMARQWRPQPER